MNFQLTFDIPKFPFSIQHTDKLLLIGSCFTENIGDKLSRFKFNNLQNPHGILFNPVSVCNALKDYMQQTVYHASQLFCLNEAWHSWHHHSRFSHPNKDIAIEQINTAITNAHHYLKQTDYLVITLGSAWTYRLSLLAPNAMKTIVAANNHKAPAQWFERKLLDNEECFNLLFQTCQQLHSFNPELKIVFTVSPVRHIREGLVDNNKSKSIPINSVHRLTETFNNLVYYFPAYEIVIDELRDYRFYAEDLVHPNYFATEYVWQKLLQTTMNKNTLALITELKELLHAYKHKPFHPQSQQHQLFLQTYFNKTKALQQAHPYLNLNEELAYFSTK